MRIGTLIVASALVAALVPASAEAGGGGPPPFCKHQSVGDHLAPVRGLPALRNPAIEWLPPRYGPRGLSIREPENLLNSRRFVGYTIEMEIYEEKARVDWDLTVSLSRIDPQGHVLGRRARQMHVRVVGRERQIGFTVGSKPAFYRIEMEIRDGDSGRRLGRFGEYVRVMRREADARVALIPASLHPGETALVSVEEHGTGFLDFGDEYSVEAFDGSTWLATAIAPHTPDPLFGLYASQGEGATCATVTIPPDTPPGRYRFLERVEHSWGTPRPHRHPIDLSTEFTVLAP